MCGIFGVALKSGVKIDKRNMRKLLSKLYILSESRGKESAGLHIYLPQIGQAQTLKGACSASNLQRSQDYNVIMQDNFSSIYNGKPSIDEPLIVLAHSRLVTNGLAEVSQNNQPVHWGNITMVHNGIVVNVDDLWTSNEHLERYADVDTEILAAIVADSMRQMFDPLSAMRTIFEQAVGAVSIAWIHDKSGVLTLATNTGDLYFIRLPEDRGIIFASERFILESASKDMLLSLYNLRSSDCIEWLAPRTVLSMNVLDSQKIAISNLSDQQDETTILTGLQRNVIHKETIVVTNAAPQVSPNSTDESLLRYKESSMRALKRCSRCVLPETFPWIKFDDKNVCNICNSYKPHYDHMQPVEARQNFIQSLEKYHRAGAAPDVLVPFSGGRDSSYGLHLIYKEFGLKPITFTYDWGMVTDLARRNIARMCGQLGVQNILVSADLKVKRNNIRKNVSAWLKKPDLGMVPLFMAGDKHFFKIVNQLKKQTGIKLDLWCANPLENTDFKSGFCGISPDFDKSRVDYLSFGRKIQLAAYYSRRFASNPSYLNSSLLDTLTAFKSYYFEPRHDFYFMFDHFIWNEKEVNQTLLSEYDWEMSPDSPSTWRIGDGSAAFYNYIYLTARGFSEFDTFRSNQIREGMITRAEALDSIYIENRPRAESLKWYLKTIGLDFNNVIKQINTLDTLELHR